MDQHAIIADLDCPFIAASDLIAASRASAKCKSLLITLNPVGILSGCFDQPIAPSPHIQVPISALLSIGSLAVAAKAADAAAAATAARPAARAAAVAAEACHYYGPGVVAAAGPEVVTLLSPGPYSLRPDSPIAWPRYQHLPVEAWKYKRSWKYKSSLVTLAMGLAVASSGYIRCRKWADLFIVYST